MSWEAETTPEFRLWFASLSDRERQYTVAAVEALLAVGPTRGRTLVDTLNSKQKNLKELRVSPTIRVFFAFDPRQVAILLIGGDKAGKTKRFYKQMIPKAEAIYETHLNVIEEEGHAKAAPTKFQRAKRRGP